MAAIGTYRHRVMLANPDDPVPDGDGGYTEGWAPLDPADWDCAIQPASARALENLAAGTVLSQASHIVTGRYHPGITTETRLGLDGPPLPYADTVVRDGASNYWRLNERSGTVAKDSIGGVTGTISGGVTLAQPGALPDGDMAMVFDGVTGKVVTAGNVSLLTPYTIEAWVKLSGSLGAEILSTRLGYPTRDVVRFFVGHTNGFPTIVLDYANTTSPEQAFPIGLNCGDGRWHHCAVVITPLNCDMYLDGVFGPPSHPLPAPFSGVSYPATMQNDIYAGFGFGSLDDVAIYPRALTASEIAAHYAAATQRATRTLNVLSVANRDERDIETQLVCSEVVA